MQSISTVASYGSRLTSRNVRAGRGPFADLAEQVRDLHRRFHGAA